MTVGGDDRLTFSLDVFEHFAADYRRSVAFVVSNK
jgi:hypothetical protein